MGSEAMEGEVEEECGNDCGGVFTDADGSTDDSHVHYYCCIFTYTADTYSIGLLHHGREEILEEKLGCDGLCL